MHATLDPQPAQRDLLWEHCRNSLGIARLLAHEGRPEPLVATACHSAVEAALRAALVEGLGLKPKLAFGPVRVAVTGRRISPPLFESIELLGRDRTLARLQSALG